MAGRRRRNASRAKYFIVNSRGDFVGNKRGYATRERANEVISIMQHRAAADPWKYRHSAASTGGMRIIER